MRCDSHDRTATCPKTRGNLRYGGAANEPLFYIYGRTLRAKGADKDVLYARSAAESCPSLFGPETETCQMVRLLRCQY